MAMQKLNWDYTSPGQSMRRNKCVSDAIHHNYHPIKIIMPIRESTTPKWNRQNRPHCTDKSRSFAQYAFVVVYNRLLVTKHQLEPPKNEETLKFGDEQLKELRVIK